MSGKRAELEKDEEVRPDETSDPSSPTISDDTESLASNESHQSHRWRDYDGSAPELQLTPHVSHVSRTSGRKNVAPSLRRTTTSKSNASGMDSAFEVEFADDDKSNPRNWSFAYRGLVIAAMSYGTTTVVLYSTSYTSAIPGLESAFGISGEIGVLGVTTYLIGLASGSIVLAPLSEMYGRRPIYICSMFMFVILVLPCALAQNMATILVTRFFGAFAASAMISNAPGSVNDVIDEEYRALAFSIWSIGPMNGPVLGPVVGGFVFQYMGWRWTNWIVMIVAGVAFCWISLLPETYAPALLRQRAAAKRKATGDSRWWSRYDEKVSLWPLLKINLSRPFVMAVTEPILVFFDIYVAIVYGILYLCFVAYPYVYSGLRGWEPGFTGLAFCGVGLGTLIVICCEPLIRKMINSHKPDPETGKPPPEAMVSVICIASLLMPIGELWFAWSCVGTHWIVSILAGIPFGAGNAGLFIYSSNYLVYSYGIYAASALAGNAVLRSIMGATLPLAGDAMYSKLGPHWASTLLALLEAACIPIPFVFYKYGSRIRNKSALIRSMREDNDRQDRRKARAIEKAEKRALAEAQEGFGMETGAAVAEEQDIEKAMMADKSKEL